MQADAGGQASKWRCVVTIRTACEQLTQYYSPPPRGVRVLPRLLVYVHAARVQRTAARHAWEVQHVVVREIAGHLAVGLGASGSTGEGEVAPGNVRQHQHCRRERGRRPPGGVNRQVYITGSGEVGGIIIWRQAAHVL